MAQDELNPGLGRRRFLRAAGALAGASQMLTGAQTGVSPETGSTTARPPNLLFILTDDQRWNCLGLASDSVMDTPNIDRLGREGVYFRNAFCTTSLCSPSRASILGGLYAHSHGVSNNFTEYPVDLPTFPRQLQAAGYQTAYIGKYHMGEENDDRRPGFDYFVTHRGQGQYFDNEFRFNGGERRVVEGYYTHVITDMAIEWLEQRDPSRPFHLYMGHKAPHSFYYPEPRYEHLFDDVDIRYPLTAFHLDDNPEWYQARLDTWHGIYGPIFDYRKQFPDRSAEGVGSLYSAGSPCSNQNFALPRRSIPPATWRTCFTVKHSTVWCGTKLDMIFSPGLTGGVCRHAVSQLVRASERGNAARDPSVCDPALVFSANPARSEARSRNRASAGTHTWDS